MYYMGNAYCTIELKKSAIVPVADIKHSATIIIRVMLCFVTFQFRNDTRSQTKKIIFSVYNFIKDLSMQAEIVSSMFAQCLKITAEACGLSERTVRCVCKEGKDSFKPEQQIASFKSPRKMYKRAKPLIELDDFDADIVCSGKYGFVSDSKLIFRANVSSLESDYHTSMNPEVFKNWFIDMLNHLEEPSVIVMDNASYHSMLKDNFPKSNNRKIVVEEWLRNKNIEFSPQERPSELCERVKQLIPLCKRYELDEIALEKGHATMDAVTQEDWEKCVAHAEKIQDEDNRKEILRDVMLEPIIITLQDDDSDWGDEEDDEDIFDVDFSLSCLD
ncbi:hypothetical protein QTP88_021723 [Uroleucon formosanum]